MSIPVPHTASLIVQLNLAGGGKGEGGTLPGRVSAYVHRPGDEGLGLNHNFWPGFVAQYDLLPGTFLDLPLELEIRRAKGKGENKCEPDLEYSYASCILNWMRREYVNANCSQGELVENLHLQYNYYILLGTVEYGYLHYFVPS